MKFGVFTDLHYSDKENDAERFFQNVPEKLERCINFFRKEKVDFMICLGDLLDLGKQKQGQEQRLCDIQKIIKESEIPFYLCLGNHDIDAFPWRKILEQFQPGRKSGYYSFDWDRFHFAVLDTNYDIQGKHYREETMQWDQLYINEEQLCWLKKDLAETEKQTLILTHGNLDHRRKNGKTDPHVVKNQEAVQRILSGEREKVLAVLQGHCHTGAFFIQDGIPYITLKALVDGKENVPLLIVQAEQEGLAITFYDLAERREV